MPTALTRLNIALIFRLELHFQCKVFQGRINFVFSVLLKRLYKYHSISRRELKLNYNETAGFTSECTLSVPYKLTVTFYMFMIRADVPCFISHNLVRKHLHIAPVSDFIHRGTPPLHGAETSGLPFSF